MKLWLATVVVGLATCVLLVVATLHSIPDESSLSGPGGASFVVAFVVAALAFATVGALVGARVPGNRIGPLFCLIGAILGIGILLLVYADAALYIFSGLPGGAAAAWLQNFGLPSCFGLLGIAVLLFPDGRPPSPRWRWVIALATGGIALSAVGYAFLPGPLDDPFSGVDNPFGIDGTSALMNAVGSFGWLFMGASVGLAALASGLRLRRARGVERAQLKWLGLAAAVTGVAIVADVVSYFAAVNGVDALRGVVLGLGFAAFPLAAGAAILRHRLYDIDLVINRALVYGALTATLGAFYIGCVLLLQIAVSPLTADSGLAIAASTLAVAALFRPARARIQDAVDRRFYRHRYDAARTLEAFGARLRDEVDLDAVGRALDAAVRDTVQPASLSLWLPLDARNDFRTDGP